MIFQMRTNKEIFMLITSLLLLACSGEVKDTGIEDTGVVDTNDTDTEDTQDTSGYRRYE